MILLKFQAAGLPVEVFLPGPKPYLVVEIPGTGGHSHDGERGAGHGNARVWLGPDAEPMCCCTEWRDGRGCPHTQATTAVITEVTQLTC